MRSASSASRSAKNYLRGLDTDRQQRRVVTRRWPRRAARLAPQRPYVVERPPNFLLCVSKMYNPWLSATAILIFSYFWSVCETSLRVDGVRRSPVSLQLYIFTYYITARLRYQHLYVTNWFISVRFTCPPSWPPEHIQYISTSHMSARRSPRRPQPHAQPTASAAAHYRSCVDVPAPRVTQRESAIPSLCGLPGTPQL